MQNLHDKIIAGTHSHAYEAAIGSDKFWTRSSISNNVQYKLSFYFDFLDQVYDEIEDWIDREIV